MQTEGKKLKIPKFSFEGVHLNNGQTFVMMELMKSGTIVNRKIVGILILSTIAIGYIAMSLISFGNKTAIDIGPIVSRCIHTMKDMADNKTFQKSTGFSAYDNNIIHILLSISGYENVMRGKAMLKSMLYFRGHFRNQSEQCQLPFEKITPLCPMGNWPNLSKMVIHIFADSKSKQWLDESITQWKLTDVSWAIYNTDLVMTCIQSIPTRHHAGPPGVLKLFLPLLLPDTIKKAIFVDVDVLFNYDVRNLWEQFEVFEPKQVLGAAFEQYSGNQFCMRKMKGGNSKINSGLLLLHLERFRKLEWGKIVHQSMGDYFAVSSSLSTADQVIWNKIISLYPQLYHQVSCEWNVQTYWNEGPVCCPVIWPVRRPNEVDCLTKVDKINQSHGQPNMARLVHLDDSKKPGAEPGPKTFTEFGSVNRTLDQASLQNRFWNLYYLFRELPKECFV